MSQLSDNNITMNQLYKKEVDADITNLSFADWSEIKNQEFAQYQKNGGTILTLVEWMQRKEDVKVANKTLNTVGLLMVLSLATYLIYITLNKSNNNLKI